MPGTVYSVPPIPPDPENTTYVEAGGLRVGVEFRLLDERELAANYEGKQMEEVQANIKGEIDDTGVSLHVERVQDGREYLRFDCFEKGPHYHYIDPSGERQTIVDFDPAALGEMLPWVMHQLRHRLDSMLDFAGGSALLPEIDRGAFEAALPRVEQIAREAQAALAGQKPERRNVAGGAGRRD